MGPNRPVGMSLAIKTPPSQGSSLNMAPVAASCITSASPSCDTFAAPKLGLTKLPASGANGGNGRGLAGLANTLAAASKLAFASLSLSATRSRWGLLKIRSNTHSPNAAGNPTFVSLLRITTPTFLSGARPTKDPKLRASPSCHTMSPFGVA